MDASKVTFIGYSLPDADYELRYLLQRSIPPNIPLDVILYKTDNPGITNIEKLRDLLPENRYRSLFTRNPLQFYYNGFGTYVAELMKRR